MDSNYKILYVLLFGLANLTYVSGQNSKRLKGFISAGQSFTGSLKYSDAYQASINHPTIEIQDVNASRTINYHAGFGVRISDSFWFNGSIGIANFGFYYTGPVTASPVNFASTGGFISTETFNMRLMEVSGMLEYKIDWRNNMKFVIQPGFAWYTNPRQQRSRILSVRTKSNSFSAVLFTGLEIPIINNNFFITAGVNTKIAVGNFIRSYTDIDSFNPYAIGLQSTISYRFW